MKDNSSENYLDQLLNSVNGEHADIQDVQEQAPLSSEEEWERSLFGEPENQEQITAKNEEDFLREFEAELLKDDMMSPFDEVDTESKQEKEKEVDDSIDDLLDQMSDQLKDEEIEPLVDENAEFEGVIPEESVSEGENVSIEQNVSDNSQDTGERSDEAETIEEAVGTFDDNLSSIPNELQSAAVVDEATATGEDGELDLSGMGDQDLMDMLSDSDDLSDLGDLLSGEQEDAPIDGEDSIGQFAQAEMDAQERDISASDDSQETKDKSKGKKEGFLARLKKLFFGDEEEEEHAIPDIGDGDDAGLSDENKKILEELEAAGELDSGAEKKGKKKKEKKKKPPKPEKPKKVKAPKPPKEKKPKEIDHTPPLPKAPVIAIAVMTLSLFGLIMLGTSLLGYQSNINLAKEEYDKGAYVEAFSKLQGLKIREKDSELYDRLQALSVVSQKYQDYLVFSSNKNDDVALDSLICAYGRYDLNKAKAEEADCSVEYEQIGGKIIKALLEEYDMTGEEALQIYQAKSRKEYTLQLRKKLKALGIQ